MWLANESTQLLAILAAQYGKAKDEELKRDIADLSRCVLLPLFNDIHLIMRTFVNQGHGLPRRLLCRGGEAEQA